MSEPEALRLQLLGDFRLWVGERFIDPAQWRLRKARTLVKLLALAPDHQLHREQLMALLWPDHEPEAAANNLHQALHVARRALEPDTNAPRFLQLRDETLSLCPDAPLWIDVEAFEAAAAGARHSDDPARFGTALDLYAGDLLPDDRYEDWASQRRESLQREHLHLLLELARLQEGRSEYAPAIETLQKVLARDPAHEEAHAGLMRLYALSGRRQQALRQYQTLQEALKRELEAEPDPQSTRLYQEILASRFPPPTALVEFAETKAASAPIAMAPPKPRHNLPAALTSFIGREKEIIEIGRLVTANRLTTLIGAGGSGKTRLALRVAAQVLGDFPDGVWFIELAPLSDPALVPQTIVSTLGLIEQAGRSPLTILADFLQGRQALLNLDNCEHLIQACAQLAETLLRQCAVLHILTTSREALGIPGEVTFLVPTLATPDIRQSLVLETLADYEAVQLFVERAQSALRGFALTSDNAPAIAQVCQRLDGIPLALELAAARVKLLRVEQIASLLDDRFILLTGGARTALPRHQTLQALIDWSHDLLPEPERVLLRRLSVFAGGWTLEAAEAVGTDKDVLDRLTQLVNKSLVLAERKQGQETRYRLLETIRQYAREKCWAAGEGDFVRQRHLAYFVELGERAEPNLRAFAMVEWLDRLEAEHDNLRVALAWALESDVEAELRLASALLWFWHIRGYKTEGGDWLERALSIEALERGEKPLWPERAMIRGKALNAAGFLRLMLLETDQAAVLSEEGLTLFRELGTAGRQGMAYAVWNLTVAATQQPNWSREKMEALAEESLALFREVGDKFGMAQSLPGLTTFTLQDGDYERTRAILEEVLALRTEIGDKDGIATALYSLGDLARQDGDYRRATTLFEASLAGFRELRNKSGMRRPLSGLGEVAQARGDYEQATQILEQALALQQDLGDKSAIYEALGDLGVVARSQGDYARAAKKFEEALVLIREVGNKTVTAGTLHALGVVALVQGDYEQAVNRYEAELAVGREIGGKDSIALALCGLGRADWAQGNYGQAAQRFEAALVVSREAADKYRTASALYGLARVAQSQADVASTRSLLAEALALCPGEGLDYWDRSYFGMAYPLEAFAALAATQQQMTRSARLFGAAEAIHNLRFELSAAERGEHERAVAAARAALGEEAFEAAYAEGKAMTREEAIEEALAV